MESIKTKLLSRLREKKKTLIDSEEQIRETIKNYFAKITLSLMEQQSQLIRQFQKTQLKIFQSIDNEIDDINSLFEASQRHVTQKIISHYQQSISEIQNMETKVVINQSQSDYRNYFRNLACIAEMNKEYQEELTESKPKSTVLRQEWNLSSPQNHIIQEDKTTNKKYQGADNNISLQEMKQSYEFTIAKMESKIEDMMIKEAKLIKKISDFEARNHKAKKGNKEGEDLGVISLKIQRLEAENKILIEQISECSEKLLKSEGSILQTQSHIPSPYPPTEKKKKLELQTVPEALSNQILVNALEKQQVNDSEPLYSPLSSQPSPMLKTITSGVQTENLKQQLNTLQTNFEELSKKNAQFEDYIKVLHKQIEENIDKKIEYQDKLIELTKNHKQKQNQLLEANKIIGKLQIKVSELQMGYSRIIQDKELVEGKLIDSKNRYVTEMKAMEQKIDKLQKKIDDGQKKNEEDRKIAHRYQQEIKMLQREMLSLQEEKTNLENENTRLKTEIKKVQKDKEKEIKRVKKQIKSVNKEEAKNEKDKLTDSFNAKFGEMLFRVETIRKELTTIREVYQERNRVFENRVNILKAKFHYDIKDILEKLQTQLASNLKIKITNEIEQTISSYIESQSTLSLRNAQIKQLKQEIQSLKKQIQSRGGSQHISHTSQQFTQGKIQQLEKELVAKKFIAQKQYHESSLAEIREEAELTKKEKESMIQKLEAHVKKLENKIRRLQENESLEGRKKMIEQYNIKEQKMEQKCQKLEALVASTKSQMQKCQQDSNNFKDELKLKKEYIGGLKKELLSKDVEKQKLMSTMDELIDSNEKLKTAQREASKKNSIINDLKAQVNENRSVQEEVEAMKRKLQSQQKTYRAQITVKQNSIRQLKAMEEQLKNQIKGLRGLENENKELKQKLKKLKIQIDRKDQLLQYSKEKADKNQKEAEMSRLEEQKKYEKLQKNYQLETNKMSALKNKSRKLQAQVQLLRVLMVKIYTKIGDTINSYSRSPQKKNKRVHKSPQKSPEFYYSTKPATQAYASNNTREQISSLQNKYEFHEYTSPNIENPLDDPQLYSAGLSILGMDFGQLMLNQKEQQKQKDQQKTKIRNKQEKEDEVILNVKNDGMRQRKVNAHSLIELLESKELDCDKIMDVFDQIIQMQ